MNEHYYTDFVSGYEDKSLIWCLGFYQLTSWIILTCSVAHGQLEGRVG